jgi:HSP20 family molecular chaperone IbpA
MQPRRRTFFEKLTGAVNLDDSEYRDYPEYSDDQSSPRIKDDRWELPKNDRPFNDKREKNGNVRDEWLEHVDTNEGELSLDMYQTEEHIIIQVMIAGVRPDDIDITITREVVTIKGHRDAPRGVEEYDYFHRELYWGAFSRTVLLPQEVEVEECDAIESHGLLILTLPKINKAKESKITVKSK